MSHTGSWVWGVASGAPVYWSEEMCRIHEREPADGPPSIEEHRALHRAEDWSVWNTALQKSIRDRTDIDCCCRLVLPSGLHRTVRLTGHPIAATAQTVTEVIGSAADLSGNQDESCVPRVNPEDPLWPLIDLIPALVWSARQDGSLEYCNRVWLDYTGLLPEQAMNWGWTVAIHPDDLGRLGSYWQSLLVAGESGEIEARLRRFDGEFRWFLFRARPHRDESGAVVKWYGTNNDIDDRKRAEEALSDREMQLRGVLETIPALVSRSAPDGRLEYVNQRVVDYLGEPLEQIGFHVVHPDDRENHVKKWLNCLETGERCENAYRLRRADGAYRWFFVGVEPVRDHEGRVIHWYAVNIDIDSSKEMEEALRIARKRLSTATQIATVAELSASIAHEINQPLASVVANGHACVTWLASDPPNLERALLTGERIIRDGNAAAEIVRRIRALFKQGPSAMVLSDINDIVGEVLRLLVDEMRDNRFIIETDLAADVPMIVVDRVQIQQALINLAHNGIEAMGSVTEGQKSLFLISRRKGAEILIQVRDSGCGIANPESIFNSFFTTKESGLGMGLAICRSIIEGHGGRLWATPNEGAGTTFNFTLPLHPEVVV